MKKIIALVLCIAMISSLVCIPVSAASGTLEREEELAGDLKALGIFKGVSETDFALGRAPTRVEALVMLVRVLGKESEALSKGGRHPFLDVPEWADKYVGYAYENNLTNGVSATKFGASSEASASMYITFVLRALGYSDKNGDFTWDNPFALAREKGILKGNPNVLSFRRADVVLVSYAALEAEVKGTGKTLADKLIEAKVFTAAQYDTYYNVSEFENEGEDRTYTSEEIYKKCSPAVFYIEVYDADGRAFATGSGFFIDADGTAVTNYHVIEGAYFARIRRSDNRNIYDVEGVYDYSEEEDWAVIKIEGKDFPYLEIEKNEKVSGGQTVYAIGSPLGFENTISEGLVSNPDLTLWGEKVIQISVPISHGSSGGALINKKGNVIGITSGGFDEGQNVNYARPISVIDGFNKGKAFAMSAAGEFEEPNYSVGHIDTTDMTRAEAATTLLSAWIENNTNVTVNGNSAFYEEKKTDGGTETIVVLYDSERGCFYIVSTFKFDSGAECVGALMFEPDGREVFANYEYYGVGADTPEISEDGTFEKRFFGEDMEVQMESYWVDDIELHADNVEALLYNSISFINQIMIRELGAYGIEGVADLGFIYF